MNNQTNKGFTLVEMAVVMVIVGLLIGLGSAMIGPMMSMSKSRETKEFLGGAVESVNSWAASNNRLPDATAGITGFKSVAKTPTDAWGRDLIYLYDSNFITASKDTICGRKTTLITLRQCLTANCATTSGIDYIDMSNVAYVVFSQGDDATIQTTSSDAAVTISRQFTSGVAVRVTLDMNYSDIVRWVTLDELRSKIGCQGAQLKILNNELPYGQINSLYPSATPLSLIVDGGVSFSTTNPQYEWCWSSTTSAILTDLPFTCTTALPSTTVVLTKTAQPCTLTTGTWQRCYFLTLAGTPNGSPPAGSYDYTLFVRDNNTNISQKSFVLTINP